MEEYQRENPENIRNQAGAPSVDPLLSPNTSPVTLFSRTPALVVIIAVIGVISALGWGIISQSRSKQSLVSQDPLTTALVIAGQQHTDTSATKQCCEKKSHQIDEIFDVEDLLAEGSVGYTLQVTNVRYADTTKDSGMRPGSTTVPAGSGNQYVIFDITIHNIDASVNLAATPAMSIQDASGRSFDVFSGDGSLWIAGTDGVSTAAFLNKGETKIVTDYHAEIPKGLSGLTLNIYRLIGSKDVVHTVSIP